MRSIALLLAFLHLFSVLYPQSRDQNYVRIKRAKVSGMSAYELSNTTNPAAASTTIIYTDGADRPLQTNHLNASIYQNDHIEFHKYDIAGRQPFSYMPMQLNIKGDYLHNWESILNQAHTDIPSAQSIFNPRGQVIEQGGFGHKYQIGTNHTTKIERYANTDTFLHKEYDAFTEKYEDKKYPPGYISIVSTTDPQGIQHTTYTSYKGQLFKRESQINKETLTTLYYYDFHYGNLTAILPPLSKGDINNHHYVYQFIHDKKGRLTRKHIPQAGIIDLSYDHLDRLIEEEDTEGNTSYIDYDRYSRVIATGIKKDGKKIPLSETHYDDYDFPFAQSAPPYEPFGKPYHNVKTQVTGTRTRILGTDQWIENVMYYDKYNRVVQSFSSNNIGGIDAVFTNYHFDGRVRQLFTYKNFLDFEKQHFARKDYEYYHNDMLKSIHYQEQGDKNTYEIAYYRYDEKGNKSYERLYEGHIKTNYHYDFHYRLTQIETNNDKNEQLFYERIEYDEPHEYMSNTPMYNGNITAMEWKTKNTPLSGYAFSYDDANQLTQAIYYQDTKQEDTYNTSYTYDKHGNITTLHRKGHLRNEVYGDLDDLEYEYTGNQLTTLHRKSLQKITVYPGDLDNSGLVEPADILPLGLHYGSTATPRDEDEQGTEWKPYTTITSTPQFSYMDADGDGIIDLKDTLAIQENLRRTHDEKDQTPEEVLGTYTYDELGNLVEDSYKGLRISYNDINLPDTMEVVGKGKIVNTYIADGSLLRREIFNKNDSLLLKYDYQGAYLYINDTLVLVSNPLGYTLKGEEEDTKAVLLTDHLGHTRVVADNKGEILQETAYYPYGQTIEKLSRNELPENVKSQYLYTGKEHLEYFNINLHDFHARQYDANLGRWFAVDPALQMHSPYQAMGNSPVMFVDPDGEWIFLAAAVGAIIGAYSGYKAGEANDAKSWGMFGYIMGGAVIGGASAVTGAAIAGSGIPFANTLAIAGGSSINSGGNHLLSGGQTDFSMSLGFGSYNFSQGEWGYFGKSGNSKLQNWGYFFGGLTNLQDMVTGFSGTEVNVNSESTEDDWWGHSSATGDGINISVGPASPIESPSDALKIIDGNGDYPNFPNNDGTWVIKLQNVNSKMMQKMTNNIQLGDGLWGVGELKWNALGFSCVNHVSRSLWSVGVPTLPLNLHPHILNLQLLTRQIGMYAAPIINY